MKVSLVLLAGALVVPQAAWSGPAVGPFFVGDFDDDGKSDLLFVGEGLGPGNNIDLARIYIIDTASVSGAADVAVVNNEDTLGAWDSDGDGQSEILSRKVAGGSIGALIIRTLDETGLVVVSKSFSQAVPLEWDYVGSGDLDADGLSDDLVFVRADGCLRVLLFTGTAFTTTFPGCVPAKDATFGIADLNGDNRADVISVQQSGGSNPGLVRGLLMGAGAASIDAHVFPALPATTYELSGVALFDSDSSADVLLQKVSGGNEGLLVVQYTNPNGQGGSGSSVVFLNRPDFDVSVLGDFDGLRQTDVMSRKGAGNSVGILYSLILDAEATGPEGSLSGFVSLVPPAFDVP